MLAVNQGKEGKPIRDKCTSKAHLAQHMAFTHLPEGRIVTPLKIAAANAAARSFLPPLAAFTAAIVAAAFCRSSGSSIGGDLFFFLAEVLFGDFLFVLLVGLVFCNDDEDNEVVIGGGGGGGGGGGAGVEAGAPTGFLMGGILFGPLVFLMFFFELFLDFDDGGGGCDPYIICRGGGG